MLLRLNRVWLKPVRDKIVVVGSPSLVKLGRLKLGWMTSRTCSRINNINIRHKTKCNNQFEDYEIAQKSRVPTL